MFTYTFGAVEEKIDSARWCTYYSIYPVSKKATVIFTMNNFYKKNTLCLFFPRLALGLTVYS